MKKLIDIQKILEYNRKTGELKRLDRKNSNGSLDKDGYLILKIKGKQYKSHRLVWLLENGKFPDNVIDHINRNKLDNRIVNLRDVPQSVNVENTKRYKNKDTGIVGVYLDKCTKGLKKKYTTRYKKKTHRFYTINEALDFRINNNLKV
jgi:hypothetical protein